MKKLGIAVAAVIVVIILVLIALPLLINANSFKPRVQDELTKALGRQVTIGDLSASIYSGGITASDLSVADDPAFAQQPFVKAKSLKIGVDVGALIFSRKVKVRSLDLISPEVRLLENQAGKWNYASLGGQSNGKNNHPGTQTSSGDDVSVDKLKIENGQIVVGQMGQPLRTYNDVALTASDLSYTTAFPYTVSAKTPGNGSLKIDGKAGPINQQDASATPLQAQISIHDLNIGTTGFTDPKSGIAGTADFTGDLQSNGKQAQSHGQATLKNAKFTPSAQPSPVPIALHYAANYNLANQVADITSGTINIGTAAAQFSGSIDTRPASPTLDLKLNGNATPVDQIQSALPAFGVVLPPSAKLEGGTLTGNFTITGPMTSTVTAGTASLSNAKVANFDLGSKLKGIGSLAGIQSGQDTTIQQFSTNLRNTTAGTQLSNLQLIVPTIGDMTGQGTIAADGTLDLHLVVKLTNGKSPVGMLTQVTGGVGSNGIPVSVKGTTQNPQFIPDVGGLVKNQLNPLGNSKSNLGGALKGLFGKKK